MSNFNQMYEAAILDIEIYSKSAKRHISKGKANRAAYCAMMAARNYNLIIHNYVELDIALRKLDSKKDK